MQSQQRFEVELPCFGNHLAVLVGMEAVDHHAVIARQALDFSRGDIAESLDPAPGVERVHRAARVLEEGRHRRRARRVGRLELEDDEAVDPVPGRLEDPTGGNRDGQRVLA
jgi:hypothetical protein